ncbi:polysaccharide biosynthesis tyrosine autokinase [Sediminivirga luteola]|uniref:polysaccharide biosynthesis tyrosine autokinase n=1 Tax=Sediminivirga luteola TaxID=1774748 RepID=UPI001F57AB0E|nr:polysaccharide biosynthesis tyrosine autokinase [Sediminivirga luteola]
MELRDYLRIVRQYWAIIVGAALLGTAVAALLSVLQTPQYQSTVRVFVSTVSEGSAAELQQGSAFTQQRVTTYADLVSTPSVLAPVAAELGMPDGVEALAGKVTGAAQANTTLVEVSATDEDPVRAADIANAVSASLTEVVEDIETTAGSETSPVKLTVVQEAVPSDSPVSPRLPVNLAAGLVIGLALGFGGAVLREILDTRVRSERDVAALTDVPVIGGVPLDKEIDEHRLVVKADPLSPHAEAYRSLRTNLDFLELERQERTFVVTSSIQAEGKSTITANLALALADAGSRVLLIDADLRRPKVERYLGVEGSVGLTDLLIGRAEPHDVIQRWGDTNLYVLASGQRPPNPSEILGSESMKSALTEFARVFDVVLIDSPPLLPVTDSAVLSRLVTGTIVVVAAGKTNRAQLSGALNTLKQVDANVSGVVLSMLPVSGSHSRYQYAYKYTYRESANEVSEAPRRRFRATQRS